MTLQKDPEGVETRQLLQAMDLTNRSVLEIGCGDGRLTWRYASSTHCVMAIDPDLIALQKAVSDCATILQPKITFLCADSTFLPFSRENFDIAILAWSL